MLERVVYLYTIIKLSYMLHIFFIWKNDDSYDKYNTLEFFLRNYANSYKYTTSSLNSFSNFPCIAVSFSLVHPSFFNSSHTKFKEDAIPILQLHEYIAHA